MLITVKGNNTLFDVFAYREIPIYEILLQFVNMNIDDWFTDYDYLDDDNLMKLLLDLNIADDSAPAHLTTNEYYKYSLTQLIKGSLNNESLSSLWQFYMNFKTCAKIASQNKDDEDLISVILNQFDEDSLSLVNATHFTSTSGEAISFLDNLEDSILNRNDISPAVTTNQLVLWTKNVLYLDKRKIINIQKNIRLLIDELFVYKNISNTKLNDLNIENDISYSVQFYKNKLYEYFKIDKIDSFCIFSIARLLNSNIVIKQCENCGDYFVPSARSDEIYCDKVHPNGRSCKQMGYENKINSDDVMKEYRRVYKNKNATKNRNKNNKPNAEENFKQWVYAAKFKLDECKDGKMGLDEFKNWLENS